MGKISKSKWPVNSRFQLSSLFNWRWSTWKTGFIGIIYTLYVHVPIAQEHEERVCKTWGSQNHLICLMCKLLRISCLEIWACWITGKTGKASCCLCTFLCGTDKIYRTTLQTCWGHNELHKAYTAFLEMSMPGKAHVCTKLFSRFPHWLITGQTLKGDNTMII